MALDQQTVLEAYRRMKTIREFEERLHTEFMTGDIPGFVHLYAGQEAVATGTCIHLGPDDYIGSTHRGHGHSIAKGCDVKGMMLEIYGKKDGLCGGKGGSMHIADLAQGMLGANAIVGGSPPLAIGAALSAKTRGTNNVAISFSGDGASNQGTTFESMNMAVVLNLPCVFVFENNGFGEGTGVEYHLGSKDIASRAAGFGLPSVKVDGTDLFAVEAAATEAIKRARSGGGPSAIEAVAKRFYGHFIGDAQVYRAEGEVEKLREEHDCLTILRAKLTGDAAASDAELDAIDGEVLQLIEASIADAKAAAYPDESDLLTDVYVSY